VAFSQTEACADAHIVNGYEDETYRPAKTVTRDQMAVYISRALVTPTGDAAIPAGPATASFTDVATSHWAYKWIEYAVAKNVIKDTRMGRTSPPAAWTAARWRSTSRAPWYHPAAMLQSPCRPAIPPSRMSQPTTGLQAGRYCADQGVVKGYPDGSYQPAGVVTRDQMAVYVARGVQAGVGAGRRGEGTGERAQRAGRREAPGHRSGERDAPGVAAGRDRAFTPAGSRRVEAQALTPRGLPRLRRSSIPPPPSPQTRSLV